MYDPHGTPVYTAVATSAATYVYNGECELVRLIFPIARATTDTVTVYNSGSAAVSTFGVFTYRTGGGGAPVSVEVGARFPNGIGIKCGTLARVIVVYRGV